MEKLLTKRSGKAGESSPKRPRVLIPYRPSITSEVEEPRPLATFNTAQLHKDKRRKSKQLIKSSSIYTSGSLESEVKQALYSTSQRDIHALVAKASTTVAQKLPGQLPSGDNPVLAYVVSQRLKLGLKTEAKKCPDEAESSNFRSSLVASSAPIAGVKDLQMLSKKLASMESATNKSIIANEFIYALRKDATDSTLDFNPYEIYIVSPDTARKYDRYYTISAFSISEVEKKGVITPVHVNRWLWERDMFNRIIEIAFFKKFKVWRLFSCWRKWIYTKKMVNCRKVLRLGLFSADVFFQKAILEVQQICMTACSASKLYSPDSKEEVSLISLHEDKADTLSGFMALQTDTCTEAADRLVELRENIVDIVFNALKYVGEKEGMFQVDENGIAREPEDPRHTQVLEWRSVREKLRRFEQMCSHLILSLLQRMVIKAIATLEHAVRLSFKQATTCIQRQNEGFSKMRKEITSQPYTQAVLDRIAFMGHDDNGDDLELLEMQATSFTEFASNVDLDAISDANLSFVSEVSTPSTQTLPPVQTDFKPLDIMDQILHEKKAKSIKPIWEVQLMLELEPQENATPSVIFEPSAEGFQSALRNLFGQYQTVVSDFIPISDDKRIASFLGHSKYDLLMLLSDDAEVSKRKPASWPNVDTLLLEYGPYQQYVAFIEKTLALTMKGVQKLIAHYNSYGEMVKRCKGVNIAASLSTDDWTVAMFQRAFALYHDEVYAIKSMVLSFLVGVVTVEASRFQEFCMTYPMEILKELEYRFPKLVAEKADLLVSDIKSGTDKMLVTPMDMEAFIQFLADVDAVEASVPQMESRLTTITNLYNVAQQFEVYVCEEEMALYKSLFTRFRQLKNAVMQAQATKSEVVHQFSAKIRSQMVSMLHQAMELKTTSESFLYHEESEEEPSALSKPLTKIRELKAELDHLSYLSKKYVEYHHLFAKIPSSKRHVAITADSSSQSWTPEEVFEEMLEVQDQLKMKQTLYETRQKWDTCMTDWYSAPLFSLVIADIRKEVTAFIKTVDTLEKNIPPNHKLLLNLHNDVVQFSSWLPTITCLLNPALKFRHWDAIKEQTGGKLQMKKDATFTIKELKETGIFDYHSAIALITNQANHEETLENMLRKISKEWTTKEFDLLPYKGFTERTTFILGGVEEIFASLEDSLTVLNIIKSSRYVAPIRHSVLDWNHRLSLALETVEYWVLCQKNWLYLENVFTAVDIQRQLASETKMFLQADKSWREVMRLISEKPTALKAVTTPGVLEAFRACNILLEQVFKSLEDYLEAKRLFFPRLYFISNSELLDILSHSKDLNCVQPYFSKLFGNIKRLELGENVSPPIIAMVSAENEKIKMTTRCYARGSPEQWLCLFEAAMHITVKHMLRTGMATYNTDAIHQWTLSNPGQVVLTLNQIHWTLDIETCFGKESCHSSLMEQHQHYLASLASIASLLKNDVLLLSKRSVISSLVTLNIHNRDVIAGLIKEKVCSSADFEWARHLRYYWDNSDNTCFLSQSCARFKYVNEYLGCLPRLVITPLSERCYLTLTSAMHLHLGGSPIGPAGTGKSETVKDLAKALGQLCLIINCSEGLDYKMMGRYFSGLCQSGIWCCFDEFNRIDVEVLSVVAQQLQCIKTAKDNHATSFIFEGRDVKLVPSCSVFITMNPSYTGRVELPDNLKSYFRPVAMMVPDTNMIAEVLLFTHSFTTASILARKLTKFYEVIKSQISHQHHYYFGLRSLKAVISLAGDYLRKMTSKITEETAGQLEKEAMLSAICSATLPRLVAKDVPAVRIILWDLFQMHDSTSKDEAYIKLNPYIEGAVHQISLEHSPSQIKKCHELYNTMLVRHGVILLGPTGGGKTSVVKLLVTALNKCYTDYYGPKSFHALSTEPSSMLVTGSLSQQAIAGKPFHCQFETINPKSVSVGELYGHSDKFTLEWKNGILARLLLAFCIQTENELNFTKDGMSARKLKEEKDSKEKGASASPLISPSEPSAPTISPTSPFRLQEMSSLTASTCRSAAYSGRFGMSYPPCAPAGWRWAMLDGPVDSEWIENLNSVLDDSKVLCLSNGERINLMPGSRVLFESDSLANASPATVSRCAVIFLDPYELGWRPLVLSWIKTLPEELPSTAVDHIIKLFDQSIETGLDFLKENSSELSCPVPGVSAVKTLCCILNGLLRSISEYHGGFLYEKASPEPEEESTSQLPQQTLTGIYIPTRYRNPAISSGARLLKPTVQKTNKPFHCQTPNALNEIIGKLFVFAFVWAFGSCFEKTEVEVDLDVSNDSLIEEVCEHKISRGGDSAMEKFDALVYDIFSEGDIVIHLPTSSKLIYSYYPNIYTNSFDLFDRLVTPPTQNVSFLSYGSDSPLASHRFLFDLFINPNEDTYTASKMSMIPIVDIIRISFLVSLMLEARSMPNIMISGKTGVGKSQLLTFLAKRAPSVKWRKAVNQTLLGKPLRSVEESESEDNSFSTIIYHISSQLESPKMQSMLASYLMRQGKSILLPPSGKSFLVCLDDLHAAPCDDYGSKPSLELLRQIIDGGGWYSRKSLMWKDVIGVNFLASHCAHGTMQSSTEAPAIPERLFSKFCLLHYPEASSRSLFTVYSTHVLKSLTANAFSKEVQNCTAKLVACAIFVLHTIRTVLIPSPLKPQYTFCLKDISKALSGLLRLNKRSIVTVEDVTLLTVNELAKVFHDRCVPEDREKVLIIISEGLRRYFKILHTTVKLKEQLSEVAFFVDSSKGYSSFKGPKKIVRYFEKMQIQQNVAEVKTSTLLFFPLACEQIIRMVRILQLPRGHILLLGLGGVGRRSCIQLAAYIANMKYHCLAPLHSQTPFSDCVEEIKSVLRQCGLLNQPTVLLATDTGAEDHQKAFFSILNELVVGGEVLELFDRDEMEIILGQLAEEITVKESMPADWSPEQLKELFVKQIFHNLHVVLCFTPLSRRLGQVCREFPGLLTEATVDVFDEWPAKALYILAAKEVQDEGLAQSPCGPLLKPVTCEVATCCVKIHSVVHSAIRKCNDQTQSFVVTPSSFIQFIATFTKSLVEQHDKLNRKRVHLELGVSHLTEADEKVLQMKSELQLLQPKVLEKAEEVEQLLVQLAEEQKEVDTLRAVVFQERMDIAKETERVTSLAREAEEDLQSVLPELKAAEKGLNSLKKSDLTEIRSYGTPPTMVMNVMSSVCLLLKEPTDWLSIKHVIADPMAFLKRLTMLDKDNVSDKLLSKLKKYTGDPNYSADKMVQYSLACQSFCQWVLAIESYCKVYRIVQPKRELHWKLSAELTAVVGRLQSKETQLTELKSRMAVLSRQCAMRQEERDNLQHKYKEIEKKLSKAEILMKSLGDEQVRWKETLSDLHSKTSTLVGDTLLLSSCLTYFGPFTPSLRQFLLTKWKSICEDNKLKFDPEFSLEGTLSDSEKVQEWYVQGLPKDSQSIQNAVLLTVTEKCPFIIDPQAQATKWLKAMLESSALIVQEYDSPKLVAYLEHAARAGTPLLVTGVPEQLSSALDPFLLPNFSDNTEDKIIIKIGKTEIECNPSFRLFLVRSKQSTKLSSDTCTKTTVINFSATLEGYQDQLLSATINLKEPTLESQYNELLLSISYDSKQLEKAEAKLLDCLSSTVHLLEDEVLEGVLNQATHTASEIKQRLQKAFETRESISNSRLKYLRVSQRGSILFFTVLSLQNLDPVYTFSSDWFVEVFRTCVNLIELPPPSSTSSLESIDTQSFEAYVDQIVNYLTLTVYKRVSYGLLSKHLLPFAFKLCSMLIMHQDETLASSYSINKLEWMALLRDMFSSDSELGIESQHSSKMPETMTTMYKKLKPKVISHEIWEGAATLDRALPAFSGLLIHIINNPMLWVEFSKSECPWLFDFSDEEINEGSFAKSKRRPSYFALAKINQFQRLILINLFCPSQIAASVKWFIKTEMGPAYTIRVPRDLKTIYKLTSSKKPALIIITPNVDPTAQLLQLAADNYQCLDTISLGQGQGEKAARCLTAGCKRGRWVFLQNCHLAKSWMPQLETLIKELQASQDVNDEFRLWLSSKSSAVLPFALLQSSIKVCLEAPTTVKANMHQLLSSQGSATVSRKDFNYGDISQWQQLVFRICLFHSMANARRAYGTEGWRVPYVFGPTDLKVSIQLLQNIFQGVEDGSVSIPWPAVHHLVGGICYGGKVTDAQDMKALKALLTRNCSAVSATAGYETVQIKSVRPGSSYDRLNRLIEELPNEDTPSALGLSPVLQSTLIKNESKSLMMTLRQLDTFSRTKGYEGRTRDEIVLERAEEFLHDLPPPFKPLLLTSRAASPSPYIHAKPSKLWSVLSPFWVLLSNELAVLNEHIQVLTTSLKCVMRELKGEVLEDQMVQDVYKALAENMAPESWKFGRDAPPSLPDWMQWFMRLHHFFEKWVAMNASEITCSTFTSSPKLPSKIWLPAFSYTNGFFEAVKQSHSRKMKIPVEDIAIKFDDKKLSRKEAKEAIVISGMKLGLAEWEPEKGLVHTTKTEQYSLMPDMVCCPVYKTVLEKEQGCWYPCPLYTSSAKQEFICTVALKTSEQPDHLDLIGVTLTL